MYPYHGRDPYSSAINADQDLGKREVWLRGTTKTPGSIQKRIINQNLRRIIRPKNALVLLNELKPGCKFKIMQNPRRNPPVFVAYVEQNNEIIGTGEGLSKNQAKNVAAENVIKNIVNETMNDNSSKIVGSDDLRNNLDPMSSLPWVELASLAIYKMFETWRTESECQSVDKYVEPEKKKPDKKEKGLPPNAHHIHPSVLLNMMMPGLTPVELQRDASLDGSFTMGYNIDGILYTGRGHSKKEAKKEAAKVVLFKYYGLIYSPQ